MGNYVFDAKALIDAVTEDAQNEDSTPRHRRATSSRCSSRAARRRCSTSRSFDVPGVSEREHGYWRDIGTLDAYYDAHMDLISPEPIFNLYNADWPILTLPDRLPPAKFVFEDPGHTGMAVDSMVCAGVIVSGGDRPALGALAGRARRLAARSSRARCCCTASRSGEGAVVRNAIVDKNVVIEPGARLGVDLEADRERFVVSAGGIVVVGKGERVAA